MGADVAVYTGDENGFVVAWGQGEGGSGGGGGRCHADMLRLVLRFWVQFLLSDIDDG